MHSQPDDRGVHVANLEPNETDDTADDLTDAQLEDVAGGMGGTSRKDGCKI